MQGGKPGRPYGRHPAIVTSDRLADACERWFARFSASERAAIGTVRDALHRIAGEAGPRPDPPCGTVPAYRRYRERKD